MPQLVYARGGAMNERGAVVVQAAVTMLVLLGFTSFVIDYGVLWLSREQAQNAADAGAMAGAVAHAYDGAASVADSASVLVEANPVWFASATAEVLPLAGACPPDAAGFDCVRVNVYRDGTAGSTPLPMFFGPVLSLVSQGVRATATAQVAVGNGTPCLKPWAIPDRWIEHRPVDKAWEPGDVFEKYQEPGGALLVPADEYVPPSDLTEGTGVAADLLGEPAALAFADPTASDPITPDFLLPLVLGGSNSYDQNIAGCNGQFVGLGEYLPTDATATSLATTDGLSALVAADASATWDSGNDRIEGSCAPACASVSPRLVALALFDVDDYQNRRATDAWCDGGVRCARVVNIVGFFIDTVTATGATGYLTKYPGLISPTHSSLVPDSSFLPAVTLVR